MKNAGTIVVADDVQANIDLLTALLAGDGYTVHTALDGAAALELVQREKPDLVLSDVLMPVLNGFDLCRRLKGDRVTRLIPVVLITSLGEREDRIEGLNAGADDFLTKPVDAHELRARVRSLVRLKRFTDDLDSSERALAAAKRDAERANRAKSDFLSRMSHDLRTPLNAILGFAQLLEMDMVNPEHRESVRHILRGGSHLLGLINEVLDIIRIESGHLSLSPEPVGVGDVVQHVVDLVRPLAAERGISFDVDIRTLGGRDAFADRQRLYQILLNLVSNAVKYNRDGGRVSITCEDVAERRVRIKVSDTGAGIPAERLNLLFQPFERLGAEETGIEGTGLGLTLSKALIEAMGGTLGVESEVDRGSTFWVELALADPAAETEASPAAARPHTSGQDSGVAGTVLYIEDNVSNRRLMERLLARRPGVRLVGMAQGQSGLDFARANRPDLILLDLHLPDMHGEEVLRRLLEDPRTRAIPVAVLSADATPAQTKRLRAAGAMAYLTKPLDVSEVLQCLDDNLHKGSS